MAQRLSHFSFSKRQTIISHKKYTTIRRWFARKRYDYYSATIRELLVTILYIGLLKASSLTTLRLFHDYFIGETTTIGYDYSSRNATTIAHPYWLSGESPKRDAATSRQWFRAARRRWHGLRYAAPPGMDP